MSRESLGDPRHNSRISLRSRRRKSGFSTVIGAVIMIAAISILGSAMLIWANTVFKAQQQTIGNNYQTNSNLLKETFLVEDVWLSKSPANYVNVTIRNIGDIGINATQVKVTDLDSNGNPLPSSSCTSPRKCSVTQTTPFPANSANGWKSSNGLISSKNTIRIDVANICWQTCGAKSLNIQVTTARGSIQLIVWQVS